MNQWGVRTIFFDMQRNKNLAKFREIRRDTVLDKKSAFKYNIQNV